MSKYSRKYCLSLAFFIASGIIQAAEFPSMVPMPRETNVSGNNVILQQDKARILVCTEHPIVRSGLSLLQKAITDLGCAALPEESAQEEDAPGGWRILLGTADAKPLVEEGAAELTPDEIQGYAIDVRPKADGGGVVLLAGHDPEGAMYACVTFARMLSAAEGNLLVLPAQVRDWPDFKLRVLDSEMELLNWMQNITDKDEQKSRRAVETAKRFIREQVVA